jgi:hypothetical protein
VKQAEEMMMTLRVWMRGCSSRWALPSEVGLLSVWRRQSDFATRLSHCATGRAPVLGSAAFFALCEADH